MNLLPKASGARPRVACEIAAQGVVAARSSEAGASLSAVARAELQRGAVTPGLKPGNIADRVHTIAMIRKALEGVGLRPNTRGADLTLIIPDGAVRVLLLEFESLPGKLSEALPLVRFRLKKLLPFEADDAMVTFQIMSHSKALVRVLAVAIPRDVLTEYETAVREAGFEPGAVLPSTLAALAGINDTEPAALVVNANTLGVTTAIVREGLLLLHRTVDLQEHGPVTPAGLPPALFGGAESRPSAFNTPLLVSVEETHAEWAAQEPLPEHGRYPYAALEGQPLAAQAEQAEEAVQNEDGITGLPVPPVYVPAAYVPRAFDPPAYAVAEPSHDRYESESANGSGSGGTHRAQPGSPANSPYAGSTVTAELSAEPHIAEFDAPTFAGALTEDRSGPAPALSGQRNGTGVPGNGSHGAKDHAPGLRGSEPLPLAHPPSGQTPDAHQQDVAEAVSVAAAYFEDTLSVAPQRVWSAGPMGADALRRALQITGVGGQDGLQVRELVEPAALLSEAVSASVPRCWLTGVVGALRS